MKLSKIIELIFVAFIGMIGSIIAKKYSEKYSNLIIFICVSVVLIIAGNSIYQTYFTNNQIIKTISKTENTTERELNKNNHKEILDTPEEIIESLKFTDTELQADNLAQKLYYGKFVEWKIKIEMLEARPNNKAEIQWEHGSAIFDNSKLLIPLKEQMYITIKGRIKVINYKSLIILDQCELRKIH